MADIINFVRDQRKRITKQQLQDKFYFRYALIACSIAFVLFVVVVCARLFLTFQVKSLIDQQTEQLTLIQAQEDNERSYLMFAAKLSKLSTLFTGRKNKQDAISFFSTLFGNTVLLKSIEYIPAEESITFGLTTNNIFALEDAVEKLQTPEVKSQFTSLSYKNLTRTKQGQYELVINVVLKEKL